MKTFTEFTEIPVQEIANNTFELIGKDWALLTAGNKDKVNTMTISWGGFGVYGNRPVTFTFIRPQRYTKQFVDTAHTLSLCFFDESYREILTYCGTKSGKDIDKIAECNLTLDYHESIPFFTQARLVLIQKVLIQQPIVQEHFVDTNFDKQVYPVHDYHDLYISEITKAFIKR